MSNLDDSLLLHVSAVNLAGEWDLGVEPISPEKIPYEANERTLAAGQVLNHLVQVTPHGVFVIDPIQGAISTTWTDLAMDETVIVAACVDRNLLFGLSGGNLISLRIEISGAGSCVNVVK